MLTALEYLDINNPNVNKFICSIINKESNNDVPYFVNPYYVLERINNRNIRKNIISTLLDNNYDFQSPFPKELFTGVIQVEKAIENLQKEYDYFIFYIHRGEEIKTQNNLKCICLNCNPKITKFAFRIGFDMVYQYKKNNEVILSIAPKQIKGVSFSNLYKKLNKIEKGTWILWDNGFVLKTKKDTTTNIEYQTIKKYLLEYMLVTN